MTVRIQTLFLFPSLYDSLIGLTGSVSHVTTLYSSDLGLGFEKWKTTEMLILVEKAPVAAWSLKCPRRSGVDSLRVFIPTIGSNLLSVTFSILVVSNSGNHYWILEQRSSGYGPFHLDTTKFSTVREKTRWFSFPIGTSEGHGRPSVVPDRVNGTGRRKRKLCTCKKRKPEERYLTRHEDSVRHTVCKFTVRSEYY